MTQANPPAPVDPSATAQAQPPTVRSVSLEIRATLDRLRALLDRLEEAQ